MTSFRRVLLVDDHAIVRHGIRMLIDEAADLRVCGEATDAVEALRYVDELGPDVVLVDLSLGTSSGIDLLKELKTRHPQLPTLVVSMHDEAVYAERALRAGARGFVGKHERSETLLAAIRRVLAGEVHVSPRTSNQILRGLSGGSEKTGVDRLSDRELAVLELIGRGRQTREIATQLRVSVKTIEAHRARIKRKLEIRTGAELAQRAVEWVQSRS